MRRLLSSDQYPNGHELGSILEAIRVEVLKGSGRIAHDGRPETRHLLGHVLDCNMKVLGMLHEAKKVAARAADSVLQVPLPKEPAQGPHFVDEGALGPCHPPRNVG